MGGMEEVGVCVVFTELPDHQATELLLDGVSSFAADGEGIFVGPEDVAVEEPGRLGFGVAVEGGLLDESGDEAVGDGRHGLGEPSWDRPLPVSGTWCHP